MSGSSAACALTGRTSSVSKNSMRSKSSSSIARTSFASFASLEAIVMHGDREVAVDMRSWHWPPLRMPRRSRPHTELGHVEYDYGTHGDERALSGPGAKVDRKKSFDRGQHRCAIRLAAHGMVGIGYENELMRLTGLGERAVHEL